MGLVQRISNLSGIPQHLFQRQGSSLEPLSQRFTFEVFHHQEIGVVLLTDVVKRADMRMVQAGNGARLPHKSLMYFRAIGKISSQYLDGYKALQPAICSLVDLAHAAFAQERQDLIRPQLGTVHQYVRLAVGKSEKTIARLVVSGEQRFHLASHGLLHANLIHVLVPLVRRSFQGAVSTAFTRCHCSGVTRSFPCSSFRAAAKREPLPIRALPLLAKRPAQRKSPQWRARQRIAVPQRGSAADPRQRVGSRHHRGPPDSLLAPSAERPPGQGSVAELPHRAWRLHGFARGPPGCAALIVLRRRKSERGSASAA